MINEHLYGLMCYNSRGTSSSHKNGMEGEIMSSRLSECICNISILYIYIYRDCGATRQL